MTIKEAILKSLEDLKEPSTSNDVFQHVIKKKYFRATTPISAVAWELGKFIQDGDTRVKRVRRRKDNLSFYYLAKNESVIDIDSIEEYQSEPLKNQPKSKSKPAKNEPVVDTNSVKKHQSKLLDSQSVSKKEPPKTKIEYTKNEPVIDEQYQNELPQNQVKTKIEQVNDESTVGIENFEKRQNELPKNQPKSKSEKSFSERDLHTLLSSFLRNSGTYTKTIFHEQSSNGKDNNQIWTHPDIVGIRFSKLQNKVNQNFLKAINRMDTFKLSSYELKKEINSDSELKKAFFQAVSNSSWANYGYLVAFRINDNLHEEMERLSQSFGIGIIELKAEPFRSKILHSAKYRELDFKTMDKLCKMNKEFEKFIEQVEKLMTAEERYYKSTEKELDEFCDDYLENDSDVRKYCIEKNIPTEEEEINV